MWKKIFLCLPLLYLPLQAVADDEYDEAIEVYKAAGASSKLFDSAYGFAVFPTIAKGAVGVGGAHGAGRAYVNRKHVGDTTMTQLSVGWQLGAEAYSEIIFFKDKRDFDEFTNGNFEFGAEAKAVAVTASAGGLATTTGSSASASAGQHDASTAGEYQNGTAVFTVTKGGLMYEAALAGQKFTYKPV